MNFSKFTFDLMSTVGKGNIEDKCRHASRNDLRIAKGQLRQFGCESGGNDAHELTILIVIEAELKRRS